MELMSWIHNTKIRGRIYELSAVVNCRSCKGVVVIVMTDDDRRLLSYGTMVGWFYDLHTTCTTCPGGHHSDEHGWGYYWNLDQVLRIVHPLDYKADLERRGGRPHFGADFLGSYPKVHITSTASPLHADAIRPRPGSGMPHTISSRKIGNHGP